MGLEGVHLKKFEEVILELLEASSTDLIDSSDSSQRNSSGSAADVTSSSSSRSSLLPRYLPLPSLPSNVILESISSSVSQRYSKSTHSSLVDSKQEDDSTFSYNSIAYNDETIPPPLWPFNILPPAACVRSSLSNPNLGNTNTHGKLSGIKAVKKEGQLISLIRCLLSMLPESLLLTNTNEAVDDKSKDTDTRRIKIVDFCGGTGTLALTLAILLPQCDIILVDLKAASLELVHQKTLDLLKPVKNEYNNNKCKEEVIIDAKGGVSNDTKKSRKLQKPTLSSDMVDVTVHENKLRQCQVLPNLYTYHGSVSTFLDQKYQFDVGMALHACGEATDLVLRGCGKMKANFIVSPCCVGKLSTRVHNPYVYHATATNEPTISYPQSESFRTILTDRHKFDALAKAADYGEMKDISTCRNASRRTAKGLLEMDRLLFMQQNYGYDHVVLTRMDPWEASPKNDILIGWIEKGQSLKAVEQRSLRDPYIYCHGGVNKVDLCHACNSDIQMTIKQLVCVNESERHLQNYPKEITSNNEEKHHPLSKLSSGDSVYWTKEEEVEFRSILNNFILQNDKNIFKFDAGMGPRKRKLVHHLAETLDLKHWSEGKKKSERIVVVGKTQKNDITV